MYIKVIGTLLFPAVFLIMFLMPVFEMIPQEQFIKVFNFNGEMIGETYDSTKYTIFTMLTNDYGTNAAQVIFLIQTILAVVCGIIFLWINRPKLATIPAAVVLWAAIFSAFRSTVQTDVMDADRIFFTGNGFWEFMNDSGLAAFSSSDSASGFIHRYKINGQFNILHVLSQYWVIWCAAIVLLAFTIVAIAVTKTLIEKKK